MKILQKMLVILILALCVGIVMPQTVVKAGDAMSAIDGIDPSKVDGDKETTGKLSDVASSILKFLQIASGIAAVIMIAVNGFRYIVETPDVKGELKKNMFPIIVGILLVFFATTIARFFIGIFSKAS